MTEFKQQLLYVNQDGINSHTTQTELGATALNGFVREAENVLKYKFTDKEKQALKSDGIAFIKNLLKSNFPFPNASEDFNLQSMGLTNVKNLYSNYERYSGSWIYFDYALTKGVFEASRLEKDKTVQSFSYYTQNEKQNRVLELAEKMIVLFDEAEKLGVLNGHGRKHITNVFDVLTVDVHPEIKEYRIMIHKRFLSTKYLY
jgi:hypothetical protein